MADVIKAVLTDIDGVWTDGRIYMNDEGNAYRSFNTLDSVAVSLLRLAEIPVIIITGEDSGIIRRRADQLKIEYIFTGVRNKLRVAEKVLKELNIQLSETAYIGDDLSDMPLLKVAGLSAVPANAGNEMKHIAGTVLSCKSGEGVFREFAEFVLKQNGIYNRIMEEYLNMIASKNY